MIVPSSFVESLKDLPHFCRPTLGKDSSTIAKEIRLHRLTIRQKNFRLLKIFGGPIVRCAIKDCIHIQDGPVLFTEKTQNGKCFELASSSPFPADSGPLACCNGCPDQKKWI
ncbi:hypothetical protein [Dubosiella newyorkensis]|uniref:hypothetical protein n=1 Tax=Dubosiella newyorkensis TaxID=1862672 RepID=UPI003F66A206